MEKNLNKEFDVVLISEEELLEVYGGGIIKSIGYAIGYAAGAASSFVYGWYSDGKDSALERCKCE